MRKQVTLRSQFLRNTLITLLVITLLSGVVQLFFIQRQITNNTDSQATLISEGIEQGLTETSLAAQSIENQIDLKMESYSIRVADRLQGRSIDEISNEQLKQLRDEMGLAGITLFQKQGDDIVGVKATEEKEIGFSFKKFLSVGLPSLMSLLKDQATKKESMATMAKGNFLSLPISQSGAHEDKPLFFKYAYYHPANSDYIICPYIQADEVNQFTKEVGPDTLIQNALNKNPYVKEIAVVNPRVFEDPSLETKLYPPLKKIVHGSYKLTNEQDVQSVKGMLKEPKKVTAIQNINGSKLYKMFLPVDQDHVIYIAMDYEKLSGPLYRHSIILLITGLISLVALFILVARFFNWIYKNIQKIKEQFKVLETGDFTAHSDVVHAAELTELSASANRTVDTLHAVLKDTSNSARQAQNLAVLLKEDSGKSVEHVFTVSMEATTNAREAADEVMDFMNRVEAYLQQAPHDEKKDKLLQDVEKVRNIELQRAAATTNMTLTLSDLLKALHEQSSELSDIANNVLQNMTKFKL